MNPAKTALLLVDTQNDFLMPNGKMHAAVKPILDQHDMPNRLNVLIRASRDAGVKIVFTPICFEEGCPEAGDQPYGIMAPVAQSGAFIRGTWGAEVAETLDRDASDLVIEKNRICAFEGTDLEKSLRDAGIETIVVAGLLTDHCVEATLRIGYDKSFEVYSVIDATATMEASKQQFTVENDFPLFSKPISHSDYLELLSSTVA